jgi:hypothetical protein
MCERVWTLLYNVKTLRDQEMQIAEQAEGSDGFFIE